MPCTHTGSSGECTSSKPEGHTLLTNSTDDQRMIAAYIVGSSDECSLCQLEGHTSLLTPPMVPDNLTHTLHRIIQRCLSLHAEDGHPPLDIHRIDRRVHPLHIGSSGERRLHSFLPQCHLSCSNLHILTPRHVFTSL